MKEVEVERRSFWRLAGAPWAGPSGAEGLPALALVEDFWKDHKGAQINSIRTRTAIERCDLVVVKFGEKYRQWNAAFDAGYAAALGKQLIVIHPPEFTHALKELDGAAQAVAQTSAQVVEILEYVTAKS